MSGQPHVPPYIVVDASVSLKWTLNDEEAVDQAVALRDAAIGGRFEMLAPSLWLYEVANGLVVATRRGRLAPDIGAQVFKHLLIIGVRLADPEAPDVYEQALYYGVAAYDAAYLALAQALGVPLWTGDRRFYDTIRDRSDLVHWIGDYL
jgi:predicted nucleic acid-binding protein